MLHRLTLKLDLEDAPKGNDELMTREFNVWKKEHNKSVNESLQITEAMLIKLKEDTAGVLVFFGAIMFGI